MKKPIATIKINEEVIPQSSIVDFTFICDIDDVYPKGKLTLNDQSGEILSKYKGLEIGAHVSISVVEGFPNSLPMDLTTKGMFFCTLIVVAIAEVPSDVSTFKGRLEILLSHPWSLYRDFSNHLYKGMQNSEILKTVLKSKARGHTFSIDESLIEISDDDGTFPRYKCGESDFDFITKKVLPYTTIAQSPALFWIDEKNRPHLQGVESLFSQNPTATAIGQAKDIKDDENLQDLVIETGDLFTYSKLMLKVGDENISEFIKPLKSKANIDMNMFTGQSIEGTVKTSLKISKSSGEYKNNILPIVNTSLLGFTDSKICTNRPIEDFTSYLINTTTPFTEMFRIEMMGNFVGDTVRVGSIINIYVPPKPEVESPLKGKAHWLSGPWLVKKIKHTVSSDINFNVATTIVAVRPTFAVNLSKSSIPNIGIYQKVK